MLHTCLGNIMLPCLEDFFPINSFLENSFTAVHAFVDSIPERSQQRYKNVVDKRLVRCKKLISDTITKNNFVSPAKLTGKTNPKIRIYLKSLTLRN